MIYNTIQTVVLAVGAVALFIYDHPLAGGAMLVVCAISLTHVTSKEVKK